MRVSSLAAIFGALSLAAILAAAPVASRADGAPGGLKARADSATAAKMRADSLAARAKADTLAARGKTDSLPAKLFAPTSTSYVKGNDVDISIGSAMSTKLNPGNGWIIENGITTERKRYRVRAGEDIAESMTGRATRSQAGLYTVDFNLGDIYSRKTTLGLGRFGKEIVYHDYNADLALSYSKPLLGAAQSLIAVGVGGRQGLDDFKYDRALLGSLNSSLTYTLGKALSVSGGFGTARRRETSEIGAKQFGAMPTSGDTLRAGLQYTRGNAKILGVSYELDDGVERSVTPPLGNSLEILSDVSKATRERAHHRGESLILSSSIAPASFLSCDVQFTHRLANQDYAVQTQLSSGTESTDLAATTTYRYAGSGTLSMKVETAKNSNDYGPTSLSSYNDRTNTLGMNLSQQVSDSILVSLTGTGYLRQSFYVKKDVNPRDADNLFYHGQANIGAGLTPKIRADITMAADRYETINISSTLSGDNRIDYTYRVGPTITVRPKSWVSLSQAYNLKIEYTDFVYQPNNNYLNRTTTLDSRASFTVFPSLMFMFRHSYLMKDTGSYLLREGESERRYNRSNANLEHAIFFDMKYDIQRDFSLKAQADFKAQRNNIFGLVNGHKGVTSSTLSDSGGMRLGFTRNKKIGDGGINLDIWYVRRYGPYITKERKEYWDVNSNIVVAF